MTADLEPSDPPPLITASELDERLRSGQAPLLIDVRDPNEWEICRIESARLIPLPTLGDAIPALDPAQDVVVYCKASKRAVRAVGQLQAAGFRRVWMLEGGILGWSEEIDPSIARY